MFVIGIPTPKETITNLIPAIADQPAGTVQVGKRVRSDQVLLLPAVVAAQIVVDSLKPYERLKQEAPVVGDEQGSNRREQDASDRKRQIDREEQKPLEFSHKLSSQPAQQTVTPLPPEDAM